MNQYPPRRQPHQQQQLVLPEPGDVGQMIVRGATSFARNHKVITGSYLLGILVLILFASGGYKLSQAQHREYNRIMDTIDLQVEYDATIEAHRAYAAYRDTKGWFTCNDLCQRYKKLYEQKQNQLNAIRQEGRARMSDAKAVAGLFSEVGVNEVQESFWGYFTSGKQFAKRQTMWDAMFMGLRSLSRGRDESIIEYGLKVLMQLLLNFSIGLIVTLGMFILGLWSIVTSYQPNPIVAVIFFIGAACAGFAFVTTYLLAMYGTAAGSVYGVLKFAETNARMARLQQDRQRQQMGNRPHYQ